MRCAVVPARAGVAHEAPQPSRQHRLLQPAWLQPSTIHTTTGKKIKAFESTYSTEQMCQMIPCQIMKQK